MIDMNKKYETKDGRPVRILCTDGPNKEFPIVAICANVVFEFAEYILVEVNPYKDWKIDDPIWVGDFKDDVVHPKHFAGLTEDGKVKTWVDGNTSHSTTHTSVWKYATKEKKNG